MKTDIESRRGSALQCLLSWSRYLRQDETGGQTDRRIKERSWRRRAKRKQVVEKCGRSIEALVQACFRSGKCERRGECGGLGKEELSRRIFFRLDETGTLPEAGRTK